MVLQYKTVQGSYETKPKDIDSESSPTSIYIRKNITQKERKDFDNVYKYWEYEECVLSLDEYKDYKIELLENALADLILGVK